MTDQNTQTAPARRNRRGVRALAWTLLCFVVLAIGIGAAVNWAQGRSLVAPEWLRTEIETRLDNALPDAIVSIGDVAAVLDERWRPRFAVRDVQFLTLDGREIVSFSEVRGRLSGRALLQGKAQLRTLDVSGVFVTLQRTREGALAASAGTGTGSVTRQAPNLARLVANLDGVFLKPVFARLSAVDVRAITLRYEDLRSNRAWTVDGGRMRVDRQGTDLQIALDLALLDGDADVATLEANYAGAIGQVASEFGFTISDLAARDIASQGPAFAWLQALDAPISGAMRGAVREDGSIAPLSAAFQIGKGFIQPQPEATAIPIESAYSYFAYLPDKQMLRFDELFVDSKWGSGRIEGQAAISEMTNGQIDTLYGQFRLSNLLVNPDNLFVDPVRIESAEMDVQLRLSPFEFRLGRLDITDQGQRLSARGVLATGEAGWQLALDTAMDGIAPARLRQLWPTRVAPKARRWVDENVFSGQFNDLNAAVRMVQGGKPAVFASFDFSEAEVRFMRSMPNITQGKGHATLLDGRFVVVLDEGGVEAPAGGYIDASGTSFIIPDVTAKPEPPAVARIRTKSSVTAALSMLDQPPLRIMQKTNRPVELATGDLELDGTVSWSLKKNPPIEEIEFDVLGEAVNLRSELLISERVLEARQVSLVASDEQVRISGAATLDGVPLEAAWTQPIGPPGQSNSSRVTGRVEVSPDMLQAFRIALPPDMVTGRGSADLGMILVKDTPPALTLRSDLRGIGLSVPQISWNKSAEAESQLEVSATLGPIPRVDAIVLNAPGLDVGGDVALTDDRQLERFRMDRLRVGGWLDAPVDLVGRGAGRPPGVVMRGGTLDLRRATFGQNADPGSADTPVTVALDRLQVSDTIAITGMSGQFNTLGGLGGTFQGTINGTDARVSGRLIPQTGRSAIEVTATDAGRVFAAAGLLKQVRGGEMELSLEPVGSEGAFDGKLRVTNVRIQDAPAIAALLNSISIVGLINELNGDGIYFSEVKADFRLAPSQITLREASAVGSSMGISMDGVFVPDTGSLQMQGVISPVYLLNSIGSVLTREGEGLFGFNYSITGTSKDPNVFVNPLTALAPGMLRNLFRRAPPDVPLVEGEEPPPPPKPRPSIAERREQR